MENSGGEFIIFIPDGMENSKTEPCDMRRALQALDLPVLELASRKAKVNEVLINVDA